MLNQNIMVAWSVGIHTHRWDRELQDHQRSLRLLRLEPLHLRGGPEHIQAMLAAEDLGLDAGDLEAVIEMG